MKIQDIFLELGKNGCLLIDYLKAIDIEPEKLIFDFNDLISKKIIDKDCSVLNADKLIKYYFPESDLWVDKCSIEKAEGNFICVKYNFKTYSHWTLYKKINNEYQLFYNSMETSSCVNNGKPDFTSVRDISNKKKKISF